MAAMFRVARVPPSEKRRDASGHLPLPVPAPMPVEPLSCGGSSSACAQTLPKAGLGGVPSYADPLPSVASASRSACLPGWSARVSLLLSSALVASSSLSASFHHVAAAKLPGSVPAPPATTIAFSSSSKGREKKSESMSIISTNLRSERKLSVATSADDRR
jgi:hypothetical protein